MIDRGIKKINILKFNFYYKSQIILLKIALFYREYFKDMISMSIKATILRYLLPRASLSPSRAPCFSSAQECQQSQLWSNRQPKLSAISKCLPPQTLYLQLLGVFQLLTICFSHSHRTLHLQYEPNIHYWSKDYSVQRQHQCRLQS